MPPSLYSNIVVQMSPSCLGQKQDDYHNRMLGANFTYKSLMALAMAKFTYLKMHGMWGAMSPKDEAIIAMVVEIKDLKGKLKLTLAVASKQKKDGNKSTGGGKKKTKNKKNTNHKQHQKTDEAWKKVPPKDGEAKQKVINKKTYNWCKHHMAWTIHSPKECNLGTSCKESTKQKSYAAAANAATVINLFFWHSLMASWMMNRGACQHVCGD